MISINQNNPKWFKEKKFLGGYSYIPKSINAPAGFQNGSVHFQTCDAIRDWNLAHVREKKCFEASFRLVIEPTVNFHIISAIWILKVGHLFDAKLDSDHSYGNRLRRKRSTNAEQLEPRAINSEIAGLFEPYFWKYREWRERGLAGMREELKNEKSILAITMDLKQFYHRIDRRFLINSGYLKVVGIELSTDEMLLTQQFLGAMRTWAKFTPEHKKSPHIGLPVGLSASKVISNVLLIEFDKLVRDELAPVYYGRYVDDIFIVLRCKQGFKTGKEVLQWLAKQLASRVQFEVCVGSPQLRLLLPYAGKSDLIFAGNKLKVFPLRGLSGLDLVEQLSSQIAKQSSERRMLPDLPDDESIVASKALLAASEESLEADALRKTDAVSIRRLGFSILLGNAEAHARDLPPGEWAALRNRLCELVKRHVLTPKGFFDYAAWLHRAFSLMIACRDYQAAIAFLKQFERVLDCLRNSTTAGSRTSQARFALAVKWYVDYFAESALQAAKVEDLSQAKFWKVIECLRSIYNTPSIPHDLIDAEKVIKGLLTSDLGRVPYREFWASASRVKVSPLPKEVLTVVRYKEIQKFRVAAKLPTPHLCVYFPTRPFALSEMTAMASGLLEDVAGQGLREVLYGLRGIRPNSSQMPVFDRNGELIVPDRERRQVRVAVTNWLTTDSEWEGAAKGSPRLTLARYRRLNRMVNQILKERSKPDYIVFPELSLPRNWADGVARKLASYGISLIAGLEYEMKADKAANQVLMALVAKTPGYNYFISLKQTKMKASYEEARHLRQKVAAELKAGLPGPWDSPVYVHGGFCFGVLICSDLTNIHNRAGFQGKVDALFVVEWNKDLPTFGFLVESAAHDVHAFIVQANNRQFGDSRVRCPFREEHRRDVVRVRGGTHDYFVVGEIDYLALRRFQSDHEPDEQGEFKPFPIGFEISPRRRSR